MPQPGVTMQVDMAGINHLVGMGFAVADLGRQSRYMQDLIACAYAHVNEEFNRETVAFAQSTGKLGHMFEWGTRGINNSRSNMRPDPMSEQARLWRNEFNPGRRESRLRFEYKPSVAKVPKPTTKKTGIPGAVLKKLKWHVFWNKAYVLESGIPVTIRPKPENTRKLLFVPNIWKGEKGFSMYNRPTNPNISEDTQGTFTIYWLTFWEGRGEEQMQAQVDRYFGEDFKKVYAKLQAGKRQPVHRISPAIEEEQIKRSVRTIRKYLENEARERVVKLRDEY